MFETTQSRGFDKCASGVLGLVVLILSPYKLTSPRSDDIAVASLGDESEGSGALFLEQKWSLHRYLTTEEQGVFRAEREQGDAALHAERSEAGQAETENFRTSMDQLLQ